MHSPMEVVEHLGIAMDEMLPDMLARRCGGFGWCHLGCGASSFQVEANMTLLLGAYATAPQIIRESGSQS